MRTHCQSGMSVPEGDTAQNALRRKYGLMSLVKRFDGPKEFIDQRSEFIEHMTNFIIRHKLEGETKKEKSHAS